MLNLLRKRAVLPLASVVCLIAAIALIVALTAGRSHDVGSGGAPAASIMPSLSVAPSSPSSDDSLASSKAEAQSAAQSSVLAMPTKTKPPPDEQTPILGPTDVASRVAGVDNNVHEGPFGPTSFRITGFYQGPQQGNWYLVYAGYTNLGDTSTLPGPAAGEPGLRVYTESPAPDYTPSLIGIYPLAGAQGDLIIQSVSDGKVSLVDSAGQDFTFVLPG